MQVRLAGGLLFLCGIAAQAQVTLDGTTGSAVDCSSLPTTEIVQSHFQGGQFDAVTGETARVLGCVPGISDAESAQLWSLRMDALIALGRFEDVISVGAEPLDGTSRTALTMQKGLGEAYLALGRLAEAETAVNEGLVLTRALNDRSAEAALLNTRGMVRARQGDSAQALEAYEQSANIADAEQLPAIATRARTNAAEAARDQSTLAGELLDKAESTASNIESPRERAFLLAAIGRRWHALAQSSGGGQATGSGDAMQRAHGALTESVELAKQSSDPLVQSYGLGYLGEMYEQEGRHSEALALARQALFAAQQSGRRVLEFRWQWLIARLHRAEGRHDQAVASYRTAIEDLQAVRPELRRAGAFADEEFAHRSAGIYLEYADFLLRQYADREFAADAEALLVEARNTVELIKATELEDYFQDDCVAALKAQTSGVDRLASDTAVLYPILLDDRLELLLTLPQGTRRSMIPIAKADFVTQANQFRHALEKRSTREYLKHARSLYDLIVRPVESQLQQARISTLVIVPDDVLRTVPLAALHDGSRFLIESYAVAVTPGLTLTDPRPIERRDVQVLLNGVSKATQGFSSLPHVESELRQISAVFNSTVLKNEEFQVEAFRSALAKSRFGVVHIASHAQFESDASKTFLLAFDDKMNINSLEQFLGSTKFSDQPVELLTLSACQTAAGDERAALGLAGIAIKAGARSALASLWFINDPASSELIGEFYRQLGDPEISKARALQQAQLHLLADRRYRHPGYWSPFLLIGNWL